MVEREKVIKAAEICLRYIDDGDCPKECPYFDLCAQYEKRVVFQPLIRDALSLIKEQVPLEPYACEGDMKCGNGCEIVGYIRESDGKIERLANYCPYCGRPVKWD